MARWEDLPKYERDYLAGMRLPEFDDTPWTPATSVSESRVALMTTAGIERRDDKPYPWFSGEFRLIPTDVDPSELVMSHLSPNFDRTGFQQDINVVFPSRACASSRPRASSVPWRSSTTPSWAGAGLRTWRPTCRSWPDCCAATRWTRC